MPSYILAASAITSTGPTHVNCNLGMSPGATAPTGFPPGIISGQTHLNDASAISARATMSSIRDWCMGLPAGTGSNLVATVNLAGRVLVPGVYTSGSTMLVQGGVLTLDAQGDSTALFVFQVGSALTVNTGGSVVLMNGASAKNVYWCEGTAVTIGVGSSFNGNILAGSAVTIATGAIVNGGIFSSTTAITMDTNTSIVPN